MSQPSSTAKGSGKRICLVVDHPLRDLDGMVLLAMHLSREGADVFLVPMYQLNEVFLLKPDLVLVNYVRGVNAYFIRTCNSIGIRVGVLDTEGGVLQDVEQFARAVCKVSKGLHIDLYCTWGQKQRRALSRCSNLMGSEIVETGCPRYDYVAPPWNQAIPDAHADADRIILFNTNFPLINPRFQTREQELRELVKAGRLLESQVEESVRQLVHAQNEVMRAIRTVSRGMHDATIVVRPHPFENPDVYRQAFYDCPNVRVIQSGGVLPWIKKSVAVVHHSCATAIESSMMGREPIHLAWFDTPVLHQPASTAVSLHATSVEHLEGLLRELWDGRCVPVPYEILEQRRGIVRDWFYACDGKSAARIARAILNHLVDASPAFPAGIRYLWRVLVSLGGVKRKLQFLLLFSGRNLYELARTIGGRGRIPTSKVLDPNQVEDIVKRVSMQVPDFRGVRISSCVSQHYNAMAKWRYAALGLTFHKQGLRGQA